MVLVLVAGVVVRLGFADFRADAPIPSWLGRWFSATVHKSVKRQASSLPALPSATDEELIAGGKIYLNDCAGCHGEPGKPPSDFGATFYPRAPQLGLNGTSFTPTQIFWVAKHGIRRTGMSAQKGSYSDEKLRLLAEFISRLPTLPPNINSAIYQKPQASAEAAGSTK
jgi:cytochrome c553